MILSVHLAGFIVAIRERFADVEHILGTELASKVSEAANCKAVTLATNSEEKMHEFAEPARSDSSCSNVA